MTGFGRAEGFGPGARWRCEIRSVNGRGLDLKLRLPSGWEELEPAIRLAVQQRIRRGSLQLTLAIERVETAQAVSLDVALLERLLALGAPYIEAGKAAAPRWDGLLALRGVLRAADSEDAEAAAARETALQAAALAAIEAALAELVESRAREGKSLREVLSALLDQLGKTAAAARQEAAQAPQAQLQRLRERLAQLAVDIDPARLAQEAALLAAKGDVAEELDRLEAHFGEARLLLQAEDPVGRRLEFLVQELSREANTLCAKATTLTLTRLGLDLKAMIDQFREQSANVE